MNRYKVILEELEEGSALVVALMVMVILTLIGISAITTSDIELRIAANERNYKIAFFHADSGIYATPKLISACIDDALQYDLPSITYLDSGTSDFYKEVLGLKAYDAANDIQYTFDNSDIGMDVNRNSAQIVPGGAMEFGSGAQGIGGGTAGGIALLYDLDSTGEGPTSAVATISAVYRKMIGIPGGL